MTTDEVIQQLEDELNLFPDWEGRYEHIISMGKQLDGIEEDKKTEQHLVKGCQSRVWLVPDVSAEKLHFDADSDAMITKGLVAMLMKIYNDRTPDEIINVDKSFIQRLGLDTHLSQNRANGLTAMMKQINLYAVASRVRSQESGDRSE